MTPPSLWLAIALPQLPLESAWPWRTRAALPAALAVHQHQRIVQLTPAAHQAGIRPGMRLAAAQALLPDLLLANRNLAQEQQHSQALALCLQSLSSQVALLAPDLAVVEIGRSLQLFGGIRALCRHLGQQLAGLPLSWRRAIAPTALGACLLAQAPHPQRRRVMQNSSLQHSLNALSWQGLPAARAHAEWLNTLGCRTLGQLQALPRPELQRRTDGALLQALDQAYGLRPLPLAWWQAPAHFAQTFEPAWPLQHSPEVLTVAATLLQQLAAWLQARHEILDHFELQLHHETSRVTAPPTVIALKVSEAGAQAEPWLRVLAEQLHGTTQIAPVQKLVLQAGPGRPQATRSHALFNQAHPHQASHALLDLLRARLGPQAILQPLPQAHYLPEQANAWAPATGTPEAQAGPAARPGAGLAPNPPARPWPQTWPRPAWLLGTPEPLPLIHGQPAYQGAPLCLRQGPERLETAWWQGGLQGRDYFIAQDLLGRYCWVYRLHPPAEPTWWLHGWFG